MTSTSGSSCCSRTTILSPFGSSRVLIWGGRSDGGAPSVGGFVRSTVATGAGAAAGTDVGGGVVTTRGPEHAVSATAMLAPAAKRRGVRMRWLWLTGHLL